MMAGPVERTIGGLHEVVQGTLVRRVPAPARVLDLGAGTGAWAGRLVRMGYRITAVEKFAESFTCPEAELVREDLNGDFSTALGAGGFDAVTAIEVIEHLENPRHFLRQCAKLLSERGLLVVTTPNVENTPGRLRFLLTGQLRMFDRDPAFNDLTHISPIQTYMFEKMVRDSGLRLVEHTYNSMQPRVTGFVAKILTRVAAPFLRGVQGGDIHVFILQKAHAPD